MESSNAAGPFFLLLFRYSVMSDDVCSFFQNVLLVSRLPWVIVVNDIGSLRFLFRRSDTMPICLSKNHNIAALPFLYF